MNYLNTHLDVNPNPETKVHACHGEAPHDVWVCSGLFVAQDEVDEPRCAEDVEQLVGAHESRTRPNVGQTEQHTQGDHEVQAVLKVGPLAPIQPVRVARPQHPVVDHVGRTPEQQKGLVVVVHDDVFVGLEELTHERTHNTHIAWSHGAVDV